uniref:Uncharacterized protein n=1 Tax=Pseudellipsoidion edaphicum TaxID=1431838 RepID=A0A3R5QMW4_9STRA|nr:hypothetical protein [Pseudellipsoidion edaphicum]QAA12048.1 hypothetical protein [Pseudellipsoidion edaphicum]
MGHSEKLSTQIKINELVEVVKKLRQQIEIIEKKIYEMQDDKRKSLELDLTQLNELTSKIENIKHNKVKEMVQKSIKEWDLEKLQNVELDIPFRPEELRKFELKIEELEKNLENEEPDPCLIDPETGELSIFDNLEGDPVEGPQEKDFEKVSIRNLAKDPEEEDFKKTVRLDTNGTKELTYIQTLSVMETIQIVNTVKTMHTINAVEALTSISKKIRLLLKFMACRSISGLKSKFSIIKSYLLSTANNKFLIDTVKISVIILLLVILLSIDSDDEP